MNTSRTLISCATTLLWAVLVASTSLAAGPASNVLARQADAVELARAGKLNSALDILAGLRSETPDNLPLLHDETVILAWAGRHDDVARNAAQLDPQATPIYVLKAIAKSARDSQRFDQAVDWYTAALGAQPHSMDIRIGLAMAQADAGDTAAGRDTLDGLPGDLRNGADALMTSAYLHQSERAFIPAISNYDAVLTLEPNRTDALRGKVLALQRTLLPRQALALEAHHPGLLTAEEIARIEADIYALALRDAIQSPDQKYSFMHVNRALNAIDERISTEEPTSQLARRLRYDRIVGLVEAMRWEQAIRYYEELLDSGDPGSAFVHHAAGRAYLTRHRPEEAETALRRGEAMDPADRMIQLDLFYALVELERLEEALAIPDRMAARLNETERVGNARVSQPNRVRMQSEIMAGIGRAYADRLHEAQERLEALVAAAPNNLDARYELGNVYRWRGWIDRAEAEYRQVLTLDPNRVGAYTGRAHNALDHGEYRVAEETLRTAQRKYVTAAAVWDLDRRWIIHNYNQLIVEARWGESTGTTFGSDQYTLDAWWFTRPLRYNYRLYVRTFDSRAEFDDGNHSRRRAALGTEWRHGPWRATGEINFDRAGIDNPGFAGRVNYRLTDQWTIGGDIELDSYATQLRADRAGIKSNRIGIDGAFHRDERYNASARVWLQDYDDGNSVLGVLMTARTQLYDRFRYRLDGYATGRAVTSSKRDAVYFNPEQAVEGLIGADNIWRQYRRYDTVLTHRLGGNLGVFNQKNFGSDAIWTIEYELSWDVNDQLALRAGVERSRRVYDGGPEDATFWHTGINGRF